MLVLAHYPTFGTKYPEYGEARDSTNPCIRLLEQAVQDGGLGGMLVMDRIPFRLQRSKSSDTPERLLPKAMINILQRLWAQVWKTASAPIAILLGKEQMQAYNQAYPKSTPLRLYDAAFYGGFDHVFIEWEDGQMFKAIRRLVFSVYHMESWLRKVWPGTLLGVKESLTTALALAFPLTKLLKAWNLPMQPLVAPKYLLSMVDLRNAGTSSDMAQSSAAAVKSNMLDTAMVGYFGHKTGPVQAVGPGRLLDTAVRLLLAECITGVEFAVSDLPSDIAKYAQPEMIEVGTENGYHIWTAKLVRSVYGIEADDKFAAVVPLLTASELKAFQHPHLQVFNSVPWPAIVRISRERLKTTSEQQTTEKFIARRFHKVVNRAPLQIAQQQTAIGPRGDVVKPLQWKTVQTTVKRPIIAELMKSSGPAPASLGLSDAEVQRLRAQEKANRAIAKRKVDAAAKLSQAQAGGSAPTTPQRDRGNTPKALSRQAADDLRSLTKYGWRRSGLAGVVNALVQRKKKAHTATYKDLLQADLDTGHRSCIEFEDRMLRRIRFEDRGKLSDEYRVRWDAVHAAQSDS